MTTEQKQRFWDVAKKLAIVIAVGLVYYVFVRLTSLSIVCPFHKLTGLYCPGCGISRMCIALIEGDFEAAFHDNACVMILLPFAAVFGLYRWGVYTKRGATAHSLAEQRLLIAAAVLLMVFWILRNLPAFSFLAPI